MVNKITLRPLICI